MTAEEIISLIESRRDYIKSYSNGDYAAKFAVNVLNGLLDEIKED